MSSSHQAPYDHPFYADANSNTAAQASENEPPPYPGETQYSGRLPLLDYSRFEQHSSTIPRRSLSDQDIKRSPKPELFTWQLEGRSRRIQPGYIGPLESQDDPEPKTYDVRRCGNFRGFNDLSFLRDAMSEPDSEFCIVHVSGGSEEYLINGVDVKFITKSCEWIVKEHCDRLDMDPKYLDMRHYPQTSVVALLRWLYIDDYTACEAMLDGEVPLMLHIQVLHLAQRLQIPKLSNQAQMHIDRVITECISTKKPVLELCESVRYVYTELRECEGLRNLLANYCISNLEAHFDNEEEAFRQTAFQSPLFHKDLIRANIESNFECHWSDKIIQMSVCEANIHSNAAVDGGTSDFTCEFHVPPEDPNSCKRSDHPPAETVAPLKPIRISSFRAPKKSPEKEESTTGSEPTRTELAMRYVPTTLPVRSMPPPARSIYDPADPTSINTYPGASRPYYQPDSPSSPPPHPGHSVHFATVEQSRETAPNLPPPHAPRAFPLRPGEPTETDIRDVLQNPPRGITQNSNRERGPKYPIPQQLADWTCEGQVRPRPTQPKPASTAAAGPFHSAAHRRQSEQLRRFELLSEMRENSKKAEQGNSYAEEKRKYKIRLTTLAKDRHDASSKQRTAAKSALAGLLNGKSDYSANAAGTPAEELERDGWGSPEGSETKAGRQTVSRPMHNPFEVGAQVAAQAKDGASPKSSKPKAGRSRDFARPRHSPFEVGPQMAAQRKDVGPPGGNHATYRGGNDFERPRHNPFDDPRVQIRGPPSKNDKSPVTGLKAADPESLGSPPVEDYEIVTLSDEEDWEMLS